MWICFRCLYTFWKVPVAHSTNIVEPDMFLMWLPRLRFTLVPRSFRSPFRRIFFVNYFSTKVQLHLYFSQAQWRMHWYNWSCPFRTVTLGVIRERLLPSCANGQQKIAPTPPWSPLLTQRRVFLSLSRVGYALPISGRPALWYKVLIPWDNFG